MAGDGQGQSALEPVPEKGIELGKVVEQRQIMRPAVCSVRFNKSNFSI